MISLAEISSNKKIKQPVIVAFLATNKVLLHLLYCRIYQKKPGTHLRKTLVIH